MPTREVLSHFSLCATLMHCFTFTYYGKVVRYFPHSQKHKSRGFVLSELSQSWA